MDISESISLLSEGEDYCLVFAVVALHNGKTKNVILALEKEKYEALNSIQGAITPAHFENREVISFPKNNPPEEERVTAAKYFFEQNFLRDKRSPGF